MHPALCFPDPRFCLRLIVLLVRLSQGCALKPLGWKSGESGCVPLAQFRKANQPLHLWFSIFGNQFWFQLV